jgi:hypothetical protein
MIMTTEEFNKEQAKISDQELIEMVNKEIVNLAKTGGQSHKMTIPPRIDDTDMILGELLRRFKSLSIS